VKASIEELKRLRALVLPGEWFIDVCNSGPSCWCRIIGNKKGSDDLKHAVSCSGELNKATAEYFVALHNNFELLTGDVS